MKEPEAWKITPPMSFGPISLGENRNLVRRKLGSFRKNKVACYPESDFFEKAGINVDFGLNDEATVILVWSHARKAMLDGVNLFEFSPKTFFDYCRQRNWTIHVDSQFGPERDELWRLVEQGIYVNWGGEYYQMAWVSVAAPGAYGKGPLVQLESCPEWDWSDPGPTDSATVVAAKGQYPLSLHIKALAERCIGWLRRLP